jgi:hypothetical protein
MRIRVFKIKTKIKDYFMLLDFKLKDYPVTVIVNKNEELFFLDLKRKFKQDTIYLYGDNYNTRPEILRLELIGTFEYKPNKAELESYPILDPKLSDINVYNNKQVYYYFSDHISFYSKSINKCTRHFISKILDKLK